MDYSSYIDVPIVIICLALGKIIKSVPVFDKISNRFIVFILPVVAIALKLLSTGSFDTNTIAVALYSSLVAIGIHQTGKQSYNIFKDMTDENSDEEE